MLTLLADEKLSYAVALHLPSEALPNTPADSTSPPHELVTLAAQLQITASASFLPPYVPSLSLASPTKGLNIHAPRPNASTGSGPGTPGSGGGPPAPPPPQINLPANSPSLAGGLQQQQQQQPPGERSVMPNDGAPLTTPNPFPAMTPGAEGYGNVEGVTVWEGAVETPDGDRVVLVKTDDGWTAVWRGELSVGGSQLSVEEEDC